MQIHSCISNCLFMTELKSGHVNNIYIMAPRQISYSGPNILPTKISESNTTNIYIFNIMSIHGYKP